MAAALLSSATDRPLAPDLAVFGEIGLLGEVRAVSRAADRVREAAALGFDRVALPGPNVTDTPLALPTVPVANVSELRRLLG